MNRGVEVTFNVFLVKEFIFVKMNCPHARSSVSTCVWHIFQRKWTRFMRPACQNVRKTFRSSKKTLQHPFTFISDVNDIEVTMP